jgi:cytochrome d ubiquinol oxidase subunit I
MMDALLLARIQFAANISFHILFPTISIALGWCLLFFRWRWLRTHDNAWLTAYRFWTQVFALTFALGVVSGITMSFQFGTNWPGFMEKAGNIAGPLLGYEVLTAFFLEATFLGVMLYGHGRVSERMHLIATLLVAFGTTMSAFWILSLNSWLHTPTGYKIIEGEFHVDSWMAVIFNPSLPYRLAHVLLASGITVAFLVAGISAWQVLRNKTNAGTQHCLRAGVLLAAVLLPIQIFVGDLHGLNTLKHQPQKIAAIEGIWETQSGAPLLLFAIPDEKTRSNRFEVGIPNLASLVLKHDANAQIQGLNEFPGTHPPVKPLFFGFRIMVGMGILMLLVSWAAVFFTLRHQQYSDISRWPKWLLSTLHWMTFSGWVATLAGWYVTEIGRQPFIIFGLLRTADVVSNVAAAHVAITLAAYLVVYGSLLVAYITVLRHLAGKPVKLPTMRVPLPGATNILGVKP